MLAKFDELLAEIKRNNPDIIFLTETWLKLDINDAIITIPGYTLFREDRKVLKDDGKTRRGGGVCIYIKSTIQGHSVACTRAENQLKNVSELDSVWVEFKILSLKLLLGCVYRPPSCSATDNTKFCEELGRVGTNGVTKIIFGDFNYPDIDWGTKQLTQVDHAAEEFLFAYHDSSLHQLIDFPTRYRSNNNPSLLDLLLVSDEKLVTEIVSDAPVGKSDHLVILANIQVCLDSKPLPKRKHKNYWKADYEQINKVILESIGYPGSAGCYQDFEEIVRHIDTHLVPLQEQKKVLKKPWVTEQHLKLINKKRTLWHTFRSSKDVQVRNRYQVMYNNLKNDITQQLREARVQYESNLINQGPKKFYQYLNNSLESKHVNFTLINCDGEMFTDPCKISEMFAEQFYTVYVREEKTPLPQLPPETWSAVSITEIHFTEEKVEKALALLKLQASPGPDAVSPVLLKNCRHTLSELLSRIMNNAMQNADLPASWKKAIVIPIYKKGNKCLASNYRPISLTSIPCKVMEKIIAWELTDFLMANHQNFLENQHGFLPGRSVSSNLISNLEVWTRAQDAGCPVDIIYLDFEKAFDTVPFARLIHKLQHYGVRGKLLDWIREYLTGRTFQVRVNGCLSPDYEVLSGVPQGSVLGPLLFLVYVSDLAENMRCRVSMFADDTKIFCDPTIEHGGLVEDLAELESWTNHWMLRLNTDKCTILYIGYNNPRLEYSINGTTLTSVGEQNDLGVTLKENLKWESQVARVVKRANTLLYMIRRAFREMSRETFLQAYKTYIRPILEHAVVAWSPYFRKDIDLLERVQRRATKIPPTLRNLPYEERLKRLGLITLEERRGRGDLIECYKVLHSHYSCNVDFFHRNNNANLRGHCLRLSSERCNRLSRKHFITNRVVARWNSLPEDIVNAPSVNRFKNRLDSFLGQQP